VDLVGDGGEDARLAQDVSIGSHVSHPMGRRGP
jgi:hypothetical protein